MSYDYEGLPVIYGCHTNGFGIECENCCALISAQCQTGRSGHASKLYRKAITKKHGKLFWSGKIIENSRAYNKINRTGRVRNFLVAYTGEIGLACPDIIEGLLKKIHEYPIHNFTLLTKLPISLWKNISLAEKCLKKIGINVPSLKNLHIGTSVGSNDFKYRIDELRRFRGYCLEVWHKPLIGPIINPNYEGIDAIRISNEKARHHARPCKQEWIDNITKSANKQGVKVYCDIERR